MRSSKGRRPQFESLESKNLLSAVGGEVKDLVAQVQSLASRRHLALNGSISGNFSQAVGIPDVGATQTLSGTGSVRPLGHVNADGNLHLLGFIAQGHATGTLTLSGPGGAVTLKLVGPTQKGFSGAPPTFSYTITSGTGRYKGATGSGTGTLHEIAAQGPQTGKPGQMEPMFVIAPQFTMTLHSNG